MIDRICSLMRKWYEGFLQKIEAWSPPGFAYKDAFYLSLLLLWLSTLPSLLFFPRYFEAHSFLFGHSGRSKTGQWIKVLDPNAVMPSFGSLIDGTVRWFVVAAIIMAVCLLVSHYMYYRKESKSIYVMKRLKDRSILRKTYVMVPLTYAAMYLVTAAAIYLLYYVFYLLVTPKMFL